MPNVQIFGVKDSPSSRAAQRFFKERGIKFQFVDLKQKPMSPAEIKRFVDRFGISSLIDTAEKAYVEEGLQYLKLTDSEWLAKIERNPKLLRLPLVRSNNRISIGHDEKAWKEMLVL
jgi:arsenate reductase (glutaredoxin)